MSRQLWIADRCRSAGLEVAEVNGWRDRGSSAFNPAGLVAHHTAGASTGEMPSLRVLIYGRSDLPGPLCNVGLGRSGKVYVVAAGRCIEPEAAILTARGLIPLREVVIGDEVWTHRNRWRSVTAVTPTMRPSVVLSAVGHPGLVCSPDHRWITRSGRMWRGGKVRGYSSEWRFGEMEVTTTSDLTGRFVLSPTQFGELPLPDLDGMRLTPELLRLAGAWVADGSIKTGSKLGMIGVRPIFYIRREKALIVEGWIEAAGFSCGQYENSSVIRFELRSGIFGQWLIEHFGRKSVDRTVPAWLLGADEKFVAPFMEGYLHGDGYDATGHGNRVTRSGINTRSRCLAVGVRLLAQNMGMYAGLDRRCAPKDIEILGKRTRATGDVWRGSIVAEKPHGGRMHERDGFWLAPVRQVSELGEVVPMIDLTVDEDETFIADGLVTHNSNHAGRGGWAGMVGNSSVMGIEAENDGRQPWPQVQLVAYKKLCRALLAGMGSPARLMCAHREWAPGRKIDPHAIDMAAWRADLGAPTPAPQPQPPLSDDEFRRRIMAKPVLSEGAGVGDRAHQFWDVGIMQALMGWHGAVPVSLDDRPNGRFDYKTRESLAAWQGRTGALVADGICGPATWAFLAAV